MPSTLVKVTDYFPVLMASANAGTLDVMYDTKDFVVERAKSYSRVDSGEMQEGWEGQVHPQGLKGAFFSVYNAVPHTIFNEYGTVNMAAQPMLGPAAEEGFEYMMSRLKFVWFG